MISLGMDWDGDINALTKFVGDATVITSLKFNKKW